MSARELYLDFGLASDKWARWSQSDIVEVENEFFMQHIDFIKLDMMSSSPNPPNEYAVTIEFARRNSKS
jgi:phage anti-repressor protein